MILWSVILLVGVSLFWIGKLNPGLFSYPLSSSDLELTGMTTADCHGGRLGTWVYKCSPDCPCSVGEGDCNSDSDCEPGLYCNSDRGSVYGWDSGMDVCESQRLEPVTPSSQEGEPTETAETEPAQARPADCHQGQLGTWGYVCSPTCLCYAGEGDCDSDLDCGGPLICLDGGGKKYGWDAGMDTCEPPESLEKAEKKQTTTKPKRTRGPPGSYTYCSREQPCGPAEGHCNSNDECTTGVCLEDIGSLFGVEPGKNFCVPDSSQFAGRSITPKGMTFSVIQDGGGADCIPNCAGKECGSDGCGGLCGSCLGDDKGSKCLASGICGCTSEIHCHPDQYCSTWQSRCITKTTSCTPGSKCGTYTCSGGGTCDLICGVSGVCPSSCECDDLCEGVICGLCKECNPATGHCENVEDGKKDRCYGDYVCVDGQCKNLCEGVSCGICYQCNPGTGHCEKVPDGEQDRCAPGNHCENGQCVPDTETCDTCAKKRCHNGDVWCYDCNGKRDHRHDRCRSNEVCKEIGAIRARCTFQTGPQCEINYTCISDTEYEYCGIDCQCETLQCRDGRVCNPSGTSASDICVPAEGSCKVGFTCKEKIGTQDEFVYCESTDCNKCVYGKCASTADHCNPDATSWNDICGLTTTHTVYVCEGNKLIKQVCNEGGSGQCRRIGEETCPYGCQNGECVYWKVCNLDEDCRDPNEKCVITEQSAEAYQGYGECVPKEFEGDIGRECTHDCHCVDKGGGSCVNFRCTGGGSGQDEGSGDGSGASGGTETCIPGWFCVSETERYYRDTDCSKGMTYSCPSGQICRSGDCVESASGNTCTPHWECISKTKAQYIKGDCSKGATKTCGSGLECQDGECVAGSGSEKLTCNEVCVQKGYPSGRCKFFACGSDYEPAGTTGICTLSICCCEKGSDSGGSGGSESSGSSNGGSGSGG